MHLDLHIGTDRGSCLIEAGGRHDNEEETTDSNTYNNIAPANIVRPKRTGRIKLRSFDIVKLLTDDDDVLIVGSIC